MRDLLLLVIAVLAVTGNAFAEISTKCPESSGRTVQLAHKHDCTKFYKCSNGQKQLSNCPEFAPGQKLHFDPELQNCTFPWEANCASRAPDCSIDEFIQPHPTNCSLYYKCENGEKVLKTCDVEQLFCSDSLECVHKDAAKCKVYDSCPTSKLLEAVLLPHHRRSLYYECVDGQYAVRRCPSGHVFDNEVRLCVSKVHCPATGIKRISHETHCGLYYECVDGVRVEKVCEDGLSFDETKGICTWSASNECSSNFNQTDLAIYFVPHAAEGRDVVDCPPEGYTFIPHECSCTKYYSCEDGNRFLEKCPEGMIYDYIRKVCDLPDAATCLNQKYTHDSYPYANCYDSPQCPIPGHFRFPNGVCSESYYECVKGRKCDLSCDTGLIFNSEKGQCDIPENVRGCNGDQPPTTTTTSRPTTPTSAWRTPVCIEGNKLPHECNCYVYYVCHNGKYEFMKCPSGEKFDWAEKKCMSEDIAQCRPFAVNECQGTCSASNSRLAHKDCDKYCTCEGGRSRVQNCPSGLYYDRHSGTCAWRENALVNSYCPNITDCTRASRFVPHYCECDLYYKCEDGGKYLAKCPGGSYFDYVLGYCVDREPHCYHEYSENRMADKCIGYCPEQMPSSPITHLEHRDCNKYCVCSMGAPFVVDCPPCSRYDSQRQACVSSNSCNCNTRASKSLWSNIPFVNNFL